MVEPGFPPPPPADGGRAAAEAAIKGPAIGLIATAVIGGLLQLGLMGINVLGIGLPQVGGGSSEEQAAALISGSMGIVFGVIGLIVAGVVLFAAMRMMQLRSWALSLVASILVMIPCISPCCLIGIPIGIWALVVLNKPEVRSSFTA